MRGPHPAPYSLQLGKSLHGEEDPFFLQINLFLIKELIFFQSYIKQ